MRRVLLVSYHFPPGGGTSVQRALKFAKYLPLYGYVPTVLTLDPATAAYGAMDPALLKQLPEAVSIERTRSWDPLAMYARLQGLKKEEVSGLGFVREGRRSGVGGLARWVRGNIFLPDARVGWVPFAIAAARRLLRARPFAAVITTGPPQSAHLVGSYLKTRLGIPWIADLRDLWTDDHHNARLHQWLPARFINRRLERHVLTRADAVVTISEALGAKLRSKARIRRYQTIPNGFDPADVPQRSRPSADRARFVVGYIGSFTEDRNSAAFAKVMGELAGEVEVRLVGLVADSVMEEFQRAGAGDALVAVGHVPHSEAMRHMAAADLLLLVVSRHRDGLNKGFIGGKLLEYLSTGTSVLGIGPPDGDAADILRRTGGGALFDYDDEDGIRAFVAGHIQRWRANEPAPPLNKDVLRAFDRRVLTGKLAAIIDEIAPTQRAASKQANPCPDRAA